MLDAKPLLERDTCVVSPESDSEHTRVASLQRGSWALVLAKGREKGEEEVEGGERESTVEEW